jgi:hypothetical protein
MIKAKIYGGDGKNPLKVNGEGEVSVVVHTHPPIEEETISLPYRSYFKNSSDSNNLIVDGSTVPQDFYISASQDYDIWVKYISSEISDTSGLTLNNFGGLSALTNGVQWIWFNQQEGEYELHEGIKTNKEFIRIGTDTAAIGTGSDAFLADVQGGGAQKSYFPSIDLKEGYGLPYGIRLRQGSTDKIIFRVRDNLAGLSVFNIVAYGVRVSTNKY